MGKLRIIRGLAGSGKSRLCVGEMAAELRAAPLGPAIYLIVPEQASFEMERWLAEECVGFLRAQVFGFRRLAWYLHSRGGGGQLAAIDDLGRQIALRRILQELDLNVLSRPAAYPRFTGEVARLLREMKMFGWQPSDVGEMCRQLAGRVELEGLAGKLADIAAIFRRWEEYKQQHQLVDPEDIMLTAVDSLEAGLIRRTRVWIDGFVFFTRPERAFIEKLLLNDNEVTVTLVGAEGASDGGIFRRPMACARQLREMAERHNLPVSVEWLGQSRRGHWQLLNRIAGGNFHQPAGSLPELWFVECDDPAAEADWLAREIVWLRRRYRYRWSDFVIVSRDFAGYESELRLALTVNGVPFAFDCPRPPARNRLLDLVEALFNLAIDRRWRFSSVFAVLKSWLLISSAAERDEIDQLENYCLAYDINSRRRWLELWDSSPEPEKEKVKVRWGQWLYSLVERLPRAGTVAGLVQALVGILTALQVFEKIGSGQAGDHADLDRQRETQFVAGAVQQVLSGLEERFGDEIMSLDDFAAIFCEAMAGTEIKTVPPSSDYVAISHFDRMKMPKRKVVFLSGLNEGVLPRRIGQGSILSVRDRRLLSKLDFELQAVGSESVRSDKFTLYALASQAGERLYLSCASYDQAGREMGPALIVRQLRGEGGDFSPPDRSEASYLTTRARAMRRLIEVEAGGGQPRWRHRFWRVVFKHLAGEEERATLKILAGPADLQSGKQVDSRLLLPSGPNQPVVVTASALESFNTCPFRYFCQRVLRLDRRRGWEPTAADYGQVLHEALRRWLQSGSADASRLIEMYDQVVARYRYGLLVHSGQAREICRRHRQNFRLVSRQLAAFIRASLFKPWQLESEFELHIDGPFREGGRLPVVLTGRIDRVDCWQCGDRVFRLLYDYKSRADRISYSQIAGGSELQLPLYLCALSGLADGHDKTVGLLYLPVRLKAEDLGEVPVDSPEVDRLLAKMRDPSMSMRGFVLDDEPGEIAAAIVGQDNFARFVRAPVGGKRPPPRGHLIVQEQFDLLLRFAVARAQAMVEQAYLRGVFAPDRQAFLSPSGNGNYACRFCDFPGVCQKGLARQQPARGRGDIDAGTFWHEVEEWSKREVKG